MEGKTGEKVGLSRCAWNNGLGAEGIISSGDSSGEALETSGDSAGEVVESSGDAAGVTEFVALARVSISTFIPWLQCPIVPQMKYLFPSEVRGMVVAPSL